MLIPIKPQNTHTLTLPYIDSVFVCVRECVRPYLSSRGAVPSRWTDTFSARHHCSLYLQSFNRLKIPLPSCSDVFPVFMHQLQTLTTSSCSITSPQQLKKTLSAGFNADSQNKKKLFFFSTASFQQGAKCLK